MVVTRSAPETAAALFPANGDAVERQAFARFSASVGTAEGEVPDLRAAALAAEPLAQEALRRDPTSAQALAILALTQQQSSDVHARALAAARINRRDLSLLGLVLEAHLAQDDFAQTIQTLDTMLRVHPTYENRFYPVLGDALADPRTLPVFARILDGSSRWHTNFYARYALGLEDLRPQLAILRLERPLADREFDRELVRRLALDGRIEEAARLVQAVGGASRQSDASGALGWAAEFPPFDWRFSDESDFRAQASRDGRKLELFARPGRGGVIADRILITPQLPFTIALAVEDLPRGERESLRLELTCPGSTEPFLAQALGQGANRIEVRGAPAGCAQFQLAINARAWSGGTTLRSRLSQITLLSK